MAFSPPPLSSLEPEEDKFVPPSPDSLEPEEGILSKIGTAAKEFAGTVGGDVYDAISGLSRAGSRAASANIENDLNRGIDALNAQAAKEGISVPASQSAPYTPITPGNSTQEAIHQAVAGGAESVANYAQGNADISREMYGQTPGDQSIPAQIGRGAGHVAAIAPTLAGGPISLSAGVLQGAGAVYGQTYNQAIEQGKTPEEASHDASIESAKTFPQLMTYMFGGRLATEAVAKILPESSPILKAIAGFGAAATANSAVSAATRIAEGQPVAPTIEQATQDILFAAPHAAGEYASAKADQAQDLARKAVVQQKSDNIAHEAARNSANLQANAAPQTAKAVQEKAVQNIEELHSTGITTENYEGPMQDQIRKGDPISADDVENQFIVLPDGYKRVGDEYVYGETGKPVEAPKSSEESFAPPAEEQAPTEAPVAEEPTTNLEQNGSELVEPPKPVPAPDWALDAQKEAGWNPKWPFVPADFSNEDFGRLIAGDPSIDAATKKQIFQAAKNLNVLSEQRRKSLTESIVEQENQSPTEESQPGVLEQPERTAEPESQPASTEVEQVAQSAAESDVEQNSRLIKDAVANPSDERITVNGDGSVELGLGKGETVLGSGGGFKTVVATVPNERLTLSERKEAKRISQESSLAETQEERAQARDRQRDFVRSVFKRIANEPTTPAPEPEASSQAPEAVREPAVGQRVMLGSQLTPFQISEKLPQTKAEKADGDQFWKVTNTKTGEVQVARTSDFRLVKPKNTPNEKAPKSKSTPVQPILPTEPSGAGRAQAEPKSGETVVERPAEPLSVERRANDLRRRGSQALGDNAQHVDFDALAKLEQHGVTVSFDREPDRGSSATPDAEGNIRVNINPETLGSKNADRVKSVVQEEVVHGAAFTILRDQWKKEGSKEPFTSWLREKGRELGRDLLSTRNKTPEKEREAIDRVLVAAHNIYYASYKGDAPPIRDFADLVKSLQEGDENPTGRPDDPTSINYIIELTRMLHQQKESGRISESTLQSFLKAIKGWLGKTYTNFKEGIQHFVGEGLLSKTQAARLALDVEKILQGRKPSDEFLPHQEKAAIEKMDEYLSREDEEDITPHAAEVINDIALNPEQQKLVNDNQNRAYKIANKYRNIPKQDYEDLKHEAVLALSAAAKNYNPAKGEFGQIASVYINNKLKSLHTKQTRRAVQEKGGSVNELTETGDERIENIPAQAEKPKGDTDAIGKIQKAVQALPERERRILELKAEGLSLREISDELKPDYNLSHEYINQLYKKTAAELQSKLREQGITSREDVFPEQSERTQYLPERKSPEDETRMVEQATEQKLAGEDYTNERKFDENGDEEELSAASKPEDDIHDLRVFSRRDSEDGMDMAAVPDLIKAVREGKTDTPFRAINEVVQRSETLRERVDREAARRAEPVNRGRQSILDQINRSLSTERISEDEASALRRFVQELPSEAIGDVALSLRSRGRNAPQGRFNFADSIATVFTHKARAGEGIDRTGIHEIWHSLTRSIPSEDRAKMASEYAKETAKYIQKNPWFMAFVGRREFTPEQYNDYRKFAPEAADKYVTKNEETGNYDIGFTPENYRYLNLDEYVAEKMSDITQGKQREYDDSVWGSTKRLFDQVVELAKNWLKPDAFKRFYRAMMDGETEMQRRTPLAPNQPIFDPHTSRESGERFSPQKDGLPFFSRADKDFRDSIAGLEKGSPKKGDAMENLRMKGEHLKDFAKEMYDSIPAKAKGAYKAALHDPRLSNFKKVLLKWDGDRQKASVEIRRTIEDINRVAPSPRDQVAVTNYLQADGDKAQLEQWRDGSKNAKMKQGYQDAIDLDPTKVKLAEGVKKLLEDKFQEGLDAGIFKSRDSFRKNYVTQFWKMVAPEETTQGMYGKLARTFKFAKERKFNNFFEGEQAGFKPASKKISDLLGVYLNEFDKTQATRQLIKDLTRTKNEAGEPLATVLGGMKSGGSTAEPSFVRPLQSNEDVPYKALPHNALQNWKWLGKEGDKNVMIQGQIGLHPDIYQHMKNVLGHSAISEWYNTPSQHLAGNAIKGAVKVLDKGNRAFANSMLGGLSTFHMVHEMKRAGGWRINPFKVEKLNPDDPKFQDATKHGLGLAGDNEAMSHFIEGFGGQWNIWHTVPPLGKLVDTYTGWLFHEYIPALKLKTYNEVLDRNMSLYKPELDSGKMTPDDVKYVTAQLVNARYGHLNRVDIGRDPTMQHFLRVALLAPDFLESNVKNYGLAAKGVYSKSGREALYGFLVTAAFISAAAKVINTVVDDKHDPHFEEPFGVVHNGKVYTMRNEAEDLYRALFQTRSYVSGRLSPGVDSALEALSGRNYRGEKIATSDLARDIATKWIPITLRAIPPVSRTIDPEKTTSVWDQFLSSQGVQVARRSPINEGYKLAGAYEKAQGKKEDAGTYPTSPYLAMRYAIEDQDPDKAKAELLRLVDSTGKPPNKIYEGFKDSLLRPWTGNKVNDQKLLRSLKGADLAQFQIAEAARNKVWQQFNQVFRNAGPELVSRYKINQQKKLTKE